VLNNNIFSCTITSKTTQFATSVLPDNLVCFIKLQTAFKYSTADIFITTVNQMPCKGNNQVMTLSSTIKEKLLKHLFAHAINNQVCDNYCNWSSIFKLYKRLIWKKSPTSAAGHEWSHPNPEYMCIPKGAFAYLNGYIW